MKLFDDFGRRLPSDGDRLFSDKPSFYYKLNQPDIEYDLILKRSIKYNFCKNSYYCPRTKRLTFLIILLTSG